MKERADFQIRPAHVDDVPIILELIRDLATYERAPEEVVATKEQLIDVLFGERPVAEVLLAFESESPVGFAVYFYNFSTWLGRAGLYLEDLFVKPEKRGKGYGRALLVELARIARDRGCGRMEWAVLNWNEPAIKFYRTLGAKPMDEWTVFRLTRAEIAKLAEATDTALEVNGALPRLDLSVDALRRARGRNITFVLTSDAHRAEELERVRYAALNAERAWLDPDRVANAWPAERLRAWATG